MYGAPLRVGSSYLLDFHSLQVPDGFKVPFLLAPLAGDPVGLFLAFKLLGSWAFPPFYCARFPHFSDEGHGGPITFRTLSVFFFTMTSSLFFFFFAGLCVVSPKTQYSSPSGFQPFVPSHLYWGTNTVHPPLPPFFFFWKSAVFPPHRAVGPTRLVFSIFSHITLSFSLFFCQAPVL